MGDRVYVGMGTYIMSGVTIGSNVVIGAKSLVTHDIPDNCVAFGLPAKVYCTLEEYYVNTVKKECLYPTKGLTSEKKREYFHNKGMC